MATRLLIVLTFIELAYIQISAGRPSLYNRQAFSYPLSADLDSTIDVPEVADKELFTSINSPVAFFDDVDLGIKRNAGLLPRTALALQVGEPTSLNIRNIPRLENSVNSKVNDLFRDSNMNSYLNPGTDVGLGVALNADSDSSFDLGADVGFGTRATISMPDVDLRGNTGVDFGIDTDLSSITDLVTDADISIGPGLNSDISTSLASAVGIDLNTGTDVNIDLDSVTITDIIKYFGVSLTKQLLKNKYFRYIFSEYVPIPTLKLVTAAISQHLTNAFKVPRTAFLPLEKNILTLSVNKELTLEMYANIIATTLSLILSDLNIITPTAARLQVIMTASAISSAISNILDVASIPRLGLSIASNSYNPFFSVLSGFEKLPYVGVDAVSRKLPPVLKTTKAASFASQFVKQLYNNLVSSERLYATFPLGVPVATYRTLSNSLGVSIAEAFGCPFTTFIANIYDKALLNAIGNLSYKTYAKVLSLATTRVLYLLGYFISGNIYIQAAIAANAVLRALQSQFLQKPLVAQIALFPGVYGLPWTARVAGLTPSKTLLNVKDERSSNIRTKIDSGLGLNTGIGVDAEIELGLGSLAGSDAGIETGIGVGVDANIGLDNIGGLALGAGVNSYRRTGSDSGKISNRRKDRSVASKLERTLRRKRSLLSDIEIDEEFERLLELDAELDTKAKTAVKPTVNVRPNVSSNIRAPTSANLGIGNSKNYLVNSGLVQGKILRLGQKGDVRGNAGLGLAVDERKGSGLGIEIGAGVGFDANNELNTDVGLGVESGLGLDAGVGLGVGSGLGIDAAVGLGAGTGLGLNAGVGFGAGAELGLDADAGLGVGIGLGLDADAGVNERKGLGLIADIGVNKRMIKGLNANKGRNLGIEVSANPDVGRRSGQDETTQDTTITVLYLLPKILTDKFYRSTALYTSYSMVGPRKVVDLIAQAMAVQFGFPVGTIFLKSYDKNIKNKELNFLLNMKAIANATTDALAETGILDSNFSVLNVYQLATAVTAKYSSLIATSLENYRI